MSTFVESLKRLYSEKHYITVDYINSLKEKNKITQEEYDYIVQGEVLTVEQCLSEMESEVGING
jgi:preprotein translocase subunit SecA